MVDATTRQARRTRARMDLYVEHLVRALAIAVAALMERPTDKKRQHALCRVLRRLRVALGDSAPANGGPYPIPSLRDLGEKIETALSRTQGSPYYESIRSHLDKIYALATP